MSKRNGKHTYAKPEAVLTIPGVSFTEPQLVAMIARARYHRAIDPQRAYASILGNLEVIRDSVLEVVQAIQGQRFPVVEDDGSVSWVALNG